MVNGAIIAALEEADGKDETVLLLFSSVMFTIFGLWFIGLKYTLFGIMLTAIGVLGTVVCLLEIREWIVERRKRIRR